MVKTTDPRYQRTAVVMKALSEQMLELMAQDNRGEAVTQFVCDVVASAASSLAATAVHNDADPERVLEIRAHLLNSVARGFADGRDSSPRGHHVATMKVHRA